MSGPSLPPLTHLQFLVLGALLENEQPGRVVRALLGRYSVRRTAPAFYQMMARLERDGLVDGWYGQVVVGDQAVTERRYRITKAGTSRWEATRRFYVETATTLRRRWSSE